MRRGICSLVYAETTLCIQKSVFLHKATLKTSFWRLKATQKQALCSSQAILHTIEAIINRSWCRAERLVRDTRLIKKFCRFPHPRYQEPISHLILDISSAIGCGLPKRPLPRFFFVLLFWACSSPARYTTMSSAAVNPPSSQSSASQTQTTAATKPAPHGQPKSLEQPRQRRRLDPENEDDETAVATSAEGSGSGAGSGSGPSSQGRAAALPKDSRNDATRSEYTVSSEEEEDNTPVPSKRSRGSTTGLRMKAVRESSEMLEPFTTVIMRRSDAFFFPRRSVAV